MNKRSSALLESIVVALCGNEVVMERAMSVQALDDEPLNPTSSTAKRICDSAKLIVEQIEQIQSEAT